MQAKPLGTRVVVVHDFNPTTKEVNRSDMTGWREVYMADGDKSSLQSEVW